VDVVLQDVEPLARLFDGCVSDADTLFSTRFSMLRKNTQFLGAAALIHRWTLVASRYVFWGRPHCRELPPVTTDVVEAFMRMVWRVAPTMRESKYFIERG
jgi:hypothetical protein